MLVFATVAYLPASSSPLTVFVHVGKTGSSTARNWLWTVATRCDKHAHLTKQVHHHVAQPNCSWVCDLGQGKRAGQASRASEQGKQSESRGLDNSLCASKDVVTGDGYGSCARVQPAARPCRYFTVLREPMNRLLSEWRYFCLGCAESGKFCGRDVTTRCPNMTIAEWAARQPNQYVRNFGQGWARHVPANYSHARAYYCSYVSGFTRRGCGDEAGSLVSTPPPDLTELDLERAAAALSAPDMLTLWTDQLDSPSDGWPRLARWLQGTRAGDALAAAPLPEPDNVGHNHDEPLAEELRAACRINELDCRLYTRLRNQSCACGGL